MYEYICVCMYEYTCVYTHTHIFTYMGFPGGSVVKNSSASAGNLGSVPGSGRSLEKEMATHSHFLAWEIPWTEKLGRLQSTGSQKS